jgi:SpoVK/Ycf46/Vps4 family AAA+-type ATPase
LFAGPPGTGKTSISKALAHKLAIRLSDRFEYGQLVEINAHSLMSKFFSEVRAAITDLLRRCAHVFQTLQSGKLVSGVFGKIRELLEERNSFVVVLIDEGTWWIGNVVVIQLV